MSGRRQLQPKDAEIPAVTSPLSAGRLEGLSARAEPTALVGSEPTSEFNVLFVGDSTVEEIAVRHLRTHTQ